MGENFRDSKDQDTAPEPSAGDEAPETASETASGQASAGESTAKAELELAKTRAAEHWDELLRTRAELENQRKRAARDVDHARRFALERFVEELLPVVDSLEMGLAAAREGVGSAGGPVEKLIEGTELTLRILIKVLQGHGVEVIDPLGQPFDPERHEAMSAQPSSEYPPNTVMLVVQKGYTLNDRLVRPAMVVVAREGGAEPA